MDRERLERCLEQVQAYRASGLKAKVAGGFAWPQDSAGCMTLTREQFDWLVAGLPWQRLSTGAPKPITVI